MDPMKGGTVNPYLGWTAEDFNNNIAKVRTAVRSKNQLISDLDKRIQETRLFLYQEELSSEKLEEKFAELQVLQNLLGKCQQEVENDQAKEKELNTRFKSATVSIEETKKVLSSAFLQLNLDLKQCESTIQTLMKKNCQTAFEMKANQLLVTEQRQKIRIIQEAIQKNCEVSFASRDSGKVIVGKMEACSFEEFDALNKQQLRLEVVGEGSIRQAPLNPDLIGFCLTIKKPFESCQFKAVTNGLVTQGMPSRGNLIIVAIPDGKGLVPDAKTTMTLVFLHQNLWGDCDKVSVFCQTTLGVKQVGQF